MTIEQIKRNVTLKFYFKDYNRSPMIGKVVDLQDSNDLSSKKMVRIVSLSNFDNFVDSNRHVKFTKIFQLESFKYIDEVKNIAHV